MDRYGQMNNIMYMSLPGGRFPDGPILVTPKVYKNIHLDDIQTTLAKAACHQE
jgi:hypothetical protein